LAGQDHLPFDLNQLIDYHSLPRNIEDFRVGGVCVAKVVGGGYDSFFGRLVSYKGIRLLPIDALLAAGKRG